ncbi:MAG: molybdopterin cofactor-binding domain-containing protein [Longimicrobiales bacterium]|nr:molybdopterin cofactor-binding domain-containing protein [Longimicrobiales bacterium]
MVDRTVTRRDFLLTGAKGGAALVVAVHLPASDLFAEEARGDGFHPAAWIRIDAEGIVSVVVDEAELGQGVLTTLPMIVAEELEADWSKVKPLMPPRDPSSWVRPISTGGSTSTRTAWDPLRKAGAAAREMLREAAARRWGVPIPETRAEKGEIIHAASGRRLAFGELVEEAARLPVPDDPPLKDPADYTLIGRPKPRVDLPEKVDGRAAFGTDVALDGMRVASVEQAPAFGARILSVDDSGARQVDGVLDVFRVPQGVAVVARDTWAALRGREALRVEWDTSPSAGLSSDALFGELEGLMDEAGEVEEERGDVEAALGPDPVTADFRLPFLDHAPMEPMNATAWVRDGGVEVWVPTQVATASQEAAARVAGVRPSRVVMNVTFAGGGFGRRLETDDVELAVEVAKRVDGPVQVLWTREDSIRHGAYRPLTVHRLRGAVAGGRVAGWHHRAAGAGGRGLVVPGMASPPYRIPALRADYHLKETAVPVGAWRSVSYTHMGFVIESFMDMLAHRAGADPYRFRRAHMTEPRLRAALDLAVEKAGWDRGAPDGRGLGVAAVSSFSSHAAEVAEVSVEDGRVRVHRVVAGIHCGRVINPDTLRGQVEGAITLALGYTLKHGITVRDGAVVQGNFTGYPLMRIDEMPEVEVYTVPSEDPPTGIGEPPVPPLAAAVANAVFAATGVRVTELPFTREALRA